MFYNVEDVDGTLSLVRFVSGRLPAEFWRDPAHVRYIQPDVIRQMICMHDGTMDDCIERTDDHLFNLYLEEDPEWRKGLTARGYKTAGRRSSPRRRPAPSG